MTATYSLLDHPWLWVIDRQGKPLRTGIRHALLDGENLMALADPDPGVEAACYRLLLAVVQASLRNRRGQVDEVPQDWPGDRIAAYLDAHEDDFDLAHPVKPFLQSPRLEGERRKTPAILKQPFVPGDDNRIMTFGFPGPNDAIDPSEAARHLVSVQAWGSGQTAGSPNPDAEKPSGSTPAGPLAGSVVAIPKGRTLAETLLLNVSTQANQGVAVWEVEPGKAPSGWIGRLAWPSRAYLLDFGPDGQVVSVAFGVGWKPEPLVNAADAGVVEETMFIYSAPDKAGVATYLRGPSADKFFYRSTPVVYGLESNLGSVQVRAAREWLDDAGRDLARITLYGRDNVGMTAASRQLRTELPLARSLVAPEGSGGSAAAHHLQTALDDTGKAAGVFAWAVRLRVEKRTARPGTGAEASRRRNGQVWAAAQPLFDTLLSSLATADPDDTDALDEMGRTYRAALRRVIVQSLLDAATANWAPMEHAKAKSDLLRGLSKCLPAPAPTDSPIHHTETEEVHA